MKLTVDGLVKETKFGPDGKIIEKDDSEDEEKEEDEVVSFTSVENGAAGNGGNVWESKFVSAFVVSFEWY
jgi:hypothetical protein